MAAPGMKVAALKSGRVGVAATALPQAVTTVYDKAIVIFFMLELLYYR